MANFYRETELWKPVCQASKVPESKKTDAIAIRAFVLLLEFNFIDPV